MRVLVIGGTGSFSTRVTQKALERFDRARAEDLVALFGAARRVVLISRVDVVRSLDQPVADGQVFTTRSWLCSRGTRRSSALFLPQ